MSQETIFLTHLVFGYIACLLWFGTYLAPRLRSMDHFNAQRVIATIHSFRFFGLVFLLPGVVGPTLPAGFSMSAAYGDLATGVLAIFALLAVRIRPMFWFFVVAFNIVGLTDILFTYYHAIRSNLPAMAAQLGSAYAIPILYVPVLTITHAAALYWLLRFQPRSIKLFAGEEAAS